MLSSTDKAVEVDEVTMIYIISCKQPSQETSTNFSIPMYCRYNFTADVCLHKQQSWPSSVTQRSAIWRMCRSSDRSILAKVAWQSWGDSFWGTKSSSSTAFSTEPSEKHLLTPEVSFLNLSLNLNSNSDIDLNLDLDLKFCWICLSSSRQVLDFRDCRLTLWDWLMSVCWLETCKQVLLPIASCKPLIVIWCAFWRWCLLLRSVWSGSSLILLEDPTWVKWKQTCKCLNICLPWVPRTSLVVYPDNHFCDSLIVVSLLFTLLLFLANNFKI